MNRIGVLHAPQAGVGFSGALHRQQIITQRNDGQEEKKDDPEGEQLRGSGGALGGAARDPETDESQRADGPDDVE